MCRWLVWGLKYLPLARPFAAFVQDAAAGALPEVSFVDPRFLGEPQGLSGDDHSLSDIRNGQAFSNQVYRAVVRGPGWPGTVLIINFDEWGGFFDHVPTETARMRILFALRGFRTLAMMIARANRVAVSSGVYDPWSVSKMIEWRWGLPALTVCDVAANNIAGGREGMPADSSDRCARCLWYRASGTC